MTSSRLKSTLFSALVVGLLAGATLAFLPACSQEQQKGTPTDATIEIEQLHSYISLTREEMIDEAEFIFVGKVTTISPTQWNQDSGEAWAGGLQLHYIEFEVLEPIVDSIGLDQRVTITVLGNSPLGGRADHALKEGDQAVVFVGQTELAWQDGRRSVFRLLGDPSDAHYILAEDGLYHGRWNEGPISLEELLNRIAQRREILVQP